MVGDMVIDSIVRNENYNLFCGGIAESGFDGALSNSEVFPKSQPLQNNLRKLRKLQRNLARMKQGSNRYARIKLKIQKLQTRKTLYFQIAKQQQTESSTVTVV
jgi:hypothetical protein